MNDKYIKRILSLKEMIEYYKQENQRLEDIIDGQCRLLHTINKELEELITVPPSENNKYKCPDESCPMRPLDGYCERNCGERIGKMKIFKLCADGKVMSKVIDDTLESLQREVSGYIETARIFSDDDLTALVNEEGWYLDLPVNKCLPRLRGDIIIVGVSGETFVSLPDDKIDILRMVFGRKE